MSDWSSDVCSSELASASHNASKPVSAPCMTLARLLRVSGDDVGDHHRHAFAHRNVQELVRTMCVGVWDEHAGTEELRLWQFFAEHAHERSEGRRVGNEVVRTC